MCTKPGIHACCCCIHSFNCKGDARTLCDGHKAYLLKKALRTFNGSVVFNRAEKVGWTLATIKLLSRLEMMFNNRLR
jgi:hypothetical protein